MERDPEHPRAELKPGALAEGVPALLPARGWGGGGVLAPLPQRLPPRPPREAITPPPRDGGSLQASWSLCVPPPRLGAPVQEIFITFPPPPISSPLCPQSSVAQCRGACSLLLC